MADGEVEPEQEERAPRGPQQRVAVVQRQARRSLWTAAAFVLGAGVAVAVPHDTGAWLPLHLFLVGGLLSAISGAAQLFAVTWSAGPPPSDHAALSQRALVAAGSVVLALGREIGAPDAVGASGGLMIVAGLALLAVLLVREVRGGLQRRFDPALRWYLTALAAGAIGAGLGIVRVLGGAEGVAARVRAAHVALNLLGLVGLTIAGTLPFFVATEARVKMSLRAGSRQQGALLVVLGGALATAAAGLLAGSRPAAAAGLFAYAAGVLGLVALVPRLGSKQLRWAGPRLVHLGAGVAWWAGGVATAAARAAEGNEPFSSTVVAVLVIGGYAQILAAALAYLGPVLRGGGHRRLSAGFDLTRSWLGLVAANVAATAVACGAARVAWAAASVWLADALARAVLLATSASPDPGNHA